MLRSVINQVSDAVRILRGNRDVSARATHLKAADGNVPFATLERKIMSTKTVLKRVALVAVAALAIGGVSAVSANAAAGGVVAIADSTGVLANTATATGIAGANNFVTLSVPSNDAGPVVVTATGGTLVSSTAGVTGSGTASIVVPASTTATVTVPTPTVGTITVNSYLVVNGVQQSTAVSSVVVTVQAAPTGTVYNHSTGYITSVVGSAATSGTDAAVATTPIYASAVVSATPVARLTVSQYASADSSTPMTTAASTAVTVSISGAGAVATSNVGALTGAVAATGATASINGVSDYYVYSNGLSGVGTITISVNGATVATKTVTFFGSASKFTATNVPSFFSVASGAAAVVGPPAVASINEVDVKVTDASGNPVAGTTVYASSATTTVVSGFLATSVVSGSDGVAKFYLNGAATGSSVITFGNLASSPTITTTDTVTVASSSVAKVSMALDASTYTAGGTMALTVSAVDSSGNPVADGTYVLFSTAPTASSNLGGALPGTSVALVGGKKTYALYAPLASGPITIAGADSTSSANAVSVTATIAGDTSALDAANAAADAAAEATDAANAATDAANAAADAADSATSAAQDAADQAGQALAAVNTLATSVAALIAGIKAQITSLTNLIVKIQKKVKA